MISKHLVYIVVAAFLVVPASAYEYVRWDVEPTIDYTKDPGIARTVYFVHMRKAAGTAVRQYFREIYQKLQCLPPAERKLVHSDQDNWRCDNLAFYHVEWLCFVGSELAALRRGALSGGGRDSSSKNNLQGLTLDAKLSHFYPQRSARFVTCLRHPIDRLLSINWYGESSHGMQFVKELHETGRIGRDANGNDLSENPDGMHKRTWYRNSIDVAKKMAAKNVTLWNEWIHDVDQSTVWNYYVARLAGGTCNRKDRACSLATQCLAVGPDACADGTDNCKEVDSEHPHGCDSLFTNDFTYPKPKFGVKRSHEPETYGVEVPADPGPSPLARWVDKALTEPCDKHSHKLVHFVNRTRRDLEDAKATLGMFDMVLISERLGEPGTKRLMEHAFGPMASDMDFPNANRGLFTHDVETQMRAGWRKAVPAESLKEMLRLNSLDIRLYWHADKLYDARIKALGKK